MICLNQIIPGSIEVKKTDKIVKHFEKYGYILTYRQIF